MEWQLQVSSVLFTSTTYGESDGEDYSGDRSGPGAGEVADEAPTPTPDAGRRVGAETLTPAGHHGIATTIFRKPEFGWYCCAKINRKESEIREQVSKEKVTRRAPFWEKIPF
uniref:Uncharacterized protein n=1 Tax=Oryza glumipatula TaxID=40148 RepID=A0A0D9ZSF6_9ORYZ